MVLEIGLRPAHLGALHAAVARKKVTAETLRDAVGLVLAHQLARVKLQTLIFFIRQEIFLAAENILVTARMCTCRMGRGLVLLLMGPFR